jgi:hypothetical protein
LLQICWTVYVTPSPPVVVAWLPLEMSPFSPFFGSYHARGARGNRHFGPVPVLVATELTLAQNGALDCALVANNGFYGTDFTKRLLFLEDGTYYASIAQSKHLTGSQWGRHQ